MLKDILIVMLVVIGISASCTTTKATYEVTESGKTCTHSVYWDEKIASKAVYLRTYNFWVSPLCKGFNTPLKGKLIKEVVLEIDGENCKQAFR